MTEMRLRARAVLPDRVLEDAVVTVSDGRIAEVADGSTAGTDEPALRLDGLTLLPGLVDVHAHGAAGATFNDADPDAARTVARHHLEHGTTTLVASLVTAPGAELVERTRHLARLTGEGLLAGIHLEGPFLSARRRGAHDEAHLRLPDRALLDGLVDGLLEAGAGHVRQVTLAPELPGAPELLDRLVAAGITVAVGHTDADHARATAAFTAGARLVTHLFNGMRPWEHRDAGAAAACLAAAARDEAVVELIADGIHLDAGTVTTVHDLLGPERIVFVSDAMAAAGSADGVYSLGPARVVVRDGVARIDDGTDHGSIAGSTSRVIDIVRWSHLDAGLPLVDAVRSASLTPARVLGLDSELGALRPGLRADLVAVDDKLEPVAVMRRGAWVHGADALEPHA